MEERIRTDVARYSGGAIFLHWLLAAALAGQIALGFAMPHGPEGFALVQLHKSVGIVILLLSLVRLAWRLTHRRPEKVEGGMNGFLASAVHWGFYAFMILCPLTGWALVSTADVDIPTLVFGTVPWPDLPISGDGEIWEELHELLAFFGIGLFALHVAGALRHHFILKDQLLARMAPGGVPRTALLLGGGVVAIGLATFLASGTPGQSGEHDHALDHEPAASGDAAASAGDGVSATDPTDEEDHGAHTHGEDAADATVTDGAASADTAAVPAEKAAAGEVSGPPPAWTIAPGGRLGFAVDNSGTALRGSFREWGGDIAFDPERPETAEIVIRVNLPSATMGDATQDQMLRGEAFLGGGAATATWRSRTVSRTGGNRYRADGVLSLKGVEKPQAITFTLSGSGNSRAVTGQATIDRNGFGVGSGPNAAGLAANVALDFEFDATRR